jgi:hypothetical protein
MWRSAVVVVLACLGSAHAQPLAPDAPPADPAWAAYDAAFDRAASGDVITARGALQDLATRYPDHPAASRANELIKTLEPTQKDPNGPSKLARGELAFWSTVGGVFLGANVCQLADCASDRAYAATYMATVGGSLAVSIALTRNGIRQGEAQLYNSAQTWGAWNGLAINDGFAETQEEAGVALGAHAAGLGVGLVLWQTWRPSEGDVALTNTVWAWSTLLTVWGHLAFDEEPTLGGVVFAGDIGLLAGALLSTNVEMSRGRTLLIDVGGVLGTLAGGLIAIGTNSDQGAGASLFIGTSLGVIAGTALSNDWDAPALPVSPAPIAGPQSTGVGLMSGGAF